MESDLSKFQIICSCIKCKQETNTSQLTKSHGDTCPVTPSTPLRFPKNIGRPAWNKGKTKETDERLLQMSLDMKERGHGGWSKTASSNGGKKGGGYRPNAGRSKKFKVFDTQGEQVTLQSSYENAVYEILCELGIRWLRPKALKYDGRNYFADFYLIDYEIWLDPKNDYKARCDEEKIQRVIKQNDIKLYVLLQTQITKEFIASLVK